MKTLAAVVRAQSILMMIPPVVGAEIPPEMFFSARVHWYAIWIQRHPYSHIHFKLAGCEKGFISERHVNL